MQHTISLKYNRDFKWLYNRGNSIAAGFLVIYYRKTGKIKGVSSGVNRLGITVSTKLGKAVTRNRVRRLIKECYRLREAEMDRGYSIVIVARTRAAQCTFTQISRDMSFLLKKSGIIPAANKNAVSSGGHSAANAYKGTNV